MVVRARSWPILLIASLAAASALSVEPVASAQTANPARARGWLGMGMEVVGSEVHVNHIVHGSPAAGIGIQVGDRLVRVADKDVSQPREVMDLVRAHEAGDVIPVVLARDGKQQTLSVTLGAVPSPDQILRMDRVGFPAPAWVNPEPTSGAPPSIASLHGRVVLLDFWATWCGPCRALSPSLSALQARYGAQGLTVVGITTDDADKASAFKSQVDMRYATVVDRSAATSIAYGVSSLPALFAIDKRGVVREVFVGYAPGEDARMEALVRTLLSEPAEP